MVIGSESLAVDDTSDGVSSDPGADPGADLGVRIWLGRHQTPHCGLWVYLRAVLPYLLQKLQHNRAKTTVVGAGPKILKTEIEEISSSLPFVSVEWRSSPAAGIFSLAPFRYLEHIRDLFRGQPAADLFHGMSNTLPITRESGATLLTLHDLLQAFPGRPPKNPLSYGKQRYYQWYLKHSLTIATKVVTGHEKTVEQINDWMDDESPPDCSVIYPPLAEQYCEQLSLTPGSQREQFFLTFVSSDPRKNFSRTLAAYAGSTLRSTHRLVIVIGNDEVLETVRENLQRAGVEKSAYIAFHPSKRRLLQLYRAAAGTLFPSLGEGFGYPIYESLSQGTPVLASQGLLAEPFHRSQEMVTLCDPESVESIRSGLEALTRFSLDLDTAESVRAELLQHLHPERCAEKLFTIYQELCGKEKSITPT